MRKEKAALRAAPNRSPAERVRFGEEGQRSAAELFPQGEAQRSGFRPKRAALRAAPNRSPAKRVRFGEEGQRSAAELFPQGEAQRSGFRPDEGRFG